MHRPVLVAEFLQQYANLNINVFIDGTVGYGGHALALLQSHSEIERLIAFDQDPLACKLAGRNLAQHAAKTTIINDNFTMIPEHLSRLGLDAVDGIFLDIGTSSMQLDSAERGFSFSKNGPLDMRMDPAAGLTAADVVNSWPEKKLGEIFRDYGEEKRWRAAAKAVVQARRKKKIVTTQELCQVLLPVLSRRRSFNPLTLIFQALRICVNDELNRLEQVLPVAVDLLTPGGILGVISFHSLEDRIVKVLFREMAKHSVHLLTKKPIVAGAVEKKANPRSRSAKMRFVMRI